MRLLLRLQAVVSLLLIILVFGAMGVGAAFPGDELAFHLREADGSFRVQILDLRTGLRRLLYPHIANSFAPLWSPDGQQVAFLTLPGNGLGNVNLCVVEADGMNLRCMDTQGSRAVRPAWSPDGAQIAFASNERGIQIIDADALDHPSASLNIASSSNPAWSPDASQIAYMLVNEEDFVNIYILDLSTHESRWLTEGVSPMWSPDGTRMAYTNDFRVMVIDADGGIPVVVADGIGPAWSPDNERLVFSRNSPYSTSLILRHLESGQETTLLTNAGTIFSASWRPR